MPRTDSNWSRVTSLANSGLAMFAPNQRLRRRCGTGSRNFLRLLACRRAQGGGVFAAAAPKAELGLDALQLGAVALAEGVAHRAQFLQQLVRQPVDARR